MHFYNYGFLGTMRLCGHHLHGGGGEFGWETRGGIRGCLSRAEGCKYYMKSGSEISFDVPTFVSFFNLYGK